MSSFQNYSLFLKLGAKNWLNLKDPALTDEITSSQNKLKDEEICLGLYLHKPRVEVAQFAMPNNHI